MSLHRIYQVIVTIYIDMSQVIHSVKTDTAYHTSSDYISYIFQ